MTNYSIVDSSHSIINPWWATIVVKGTANKYIVEYDHGEKSSIVDTVQLYKASNKTIWLNALLCWKLGWAKQSNIGYARGN